MISLRRRAGFTIMEMLVVVGIIAVLVGILLPALAGAQKRSRKNTELNYLRQVGFAWTMYANNYEDAALPGYLEPDVQTLWDVEWETPFHQTVSEDDAAKYPWRLLPFLDFNIEVLMFYNDEYELDLTNEADVKRVARHPAFGYNAYYIGGWWTTEDVSGTTVAKPAFHDAIVAGGGSRPANPVATRVTHIKRSTETITFCSSTPTAESAVKKSSDLDDGSHIAHAPRVGPNEHWTSFGSGGGDGTATVQQGAGSIYDVQVHGRSAVPLGRYTELAAVLFADGHTETQTPAAMSNMRLWVPTADDPNFAHTAGSLPVDTFSFQGTPMPGP